MIQAFQVTVFFNKEREEINNETNKKNIVESKEGKKNRVYSYRHFHHHVQFYFLLSLFFHRGTNENSGLPLVVNLCLQASKEKRT